MKSSSTVVSVIVIAAVLVFSYAVGLLIRQVRTGRQEPPPPAAAGELPSGADVSQGPGKTATPDTPQERARLKDQKAQAIEQMSTLTEEQEEKFRQQVHQQVGGRRGGAGLENPSPQRRPVRQIQAPEGQRTEDEGQRTEDAGQGTAPSSVFRRPSSEASPADPPPEDVNRPASQSQGR